MAAPIGNNFWELRSKHGRDKIFETPEIMWESAVEYFQWCEENPLKESVLHGKDSKIIELPKMRAFTLEGLCLFLHVNTRYFNDFADSLKGKEDESSKGFSEIITRIRETIRNQQYTGAAGEFLNPNLVARYLGLKDRTDLTSKDDRLPDNMESVVSIISRLNADDLIRIANGNGTP